MGLKGKEENENKTFFKISPIITQNRFNKTPNLQKSIFNSRK